LLLPSCGQTSPKSSKNKPVAYTRVFFNENPFATSSGWTDAHVSPLKQDFAQKTSSQSGFSVEMLVAQATCQCLPKFQETYLRELAQSRGVLPEALSPAVRETVKESGILKVIQAIPGLTGSTGLMSLFMTDKRLANQIKDSIERKLSTSLNTGALSLRSQIDYNFDLFRSPLAKSTSRTQFSPSFNTTELASKWINIMSDGRLWDRFEESKKDSYGQATQALMVANTVAEMTYLYGVDPVVSGQRYGGITVDPFKSMTALGPYIEGVKNQNPIASGDYTVQFSADSSFTLALEGKETWSRNDSAKISLLEQSRFLHGMGLAYLRLQPSRRNPALINLFNSQSGGFFPKDVHKLPLVGLSAVSGLLSKGYIDLPNFTIRQFPKFTAQDQETVADLPSLLALVEALNVWVVALENYKFDELPTDIAREIEAARPMLKDALRLAVQNILAQHVTHGKVEGFDFAGFTLVSSKTVNKAADFATYARAIAILATIDQTSFQEAVYISTDLRVKIMELTHGFVKHFLKPLALGQSMLSNELNAESLVWLYFMLQKVGAYSPDQFQAPWLQDLSRQVSGLLSQVSGEVF
jgi:hypothetical protein